MEPLLDAVEARIVGALVEKQITTPDNYPLTLNALTTACNQKSNRYPVVALTKGRWCVRSSNCATKVWRGWSQAPTSACPSTTTFSPRSSSSACHRWRL